MKTSCLIVIILQHSPEFSSIFCNRDFMGYCSPNLPKHFYVIFQIWAYFCIILHFRLFNFLIFCSIESKSIWNMSHNFYSLFGISLWSSFLNPLINLISGSHLALICEPSCSNYLFFSLWAHVGYIIYSSTKFYLWTIDLFKYHKI